MAAALPTGALLVARWNREAQVWLDGEVTQVLGVAPVLDAVLADLTSSGLPQVRPTRQCQPHMQSFPQSLIRELVSHNSRAPHILHACQGAQQMKACFPCTGRLNSTRLEALPAVVARHARPVLGMARICAKLSLGPLAG